MLLPMPALASQAPPAACPGANNKPVLVCVFVCHTYFHYHNKEDDIELTFCSCFFLFLLSIVFYLYPSQH